MVQYQGLPRNGGWWSEAPSVRLACLCARTDLLFLPVRYRGAHQMVDLTMPESRYQIMAKEGGLWWVVPQGSVFTIQCLGPIEDKEHIMETMAKFLEEQDYGEG
jgi:hypothetical protein